MTYSVVVRDPVSGDLGVAVQSHFFAVGAVVPWAEAGVGAVATQFVPDTRYGRLGLDVLRTGSTAAETLARLLSQDDHPELRQVAMVDARGGVAVHTGAQCIRAAGSRVGDGWSVQGNVLESERVLDAMAAAITETRSERDLARRLVAVLRAAENAGGDVRGSQAAGVLVVSSIPGTDPVVDLRVDDSADPVTELERLLIRHRATAQLGPALGLVVAGDNRTAPAQLDAALAGAYEAGRTADGSNPEVPLWRAVLLARAGRFEEARAEYRAALRCEPRLHDMGERLADAGFVSAAAVQALTS
ncbi:DUF1028 domain-containing protein [Mycobacterium sp. NPDC051198]